MDSVRIFKTYLRSSIRENFPWRKPGVVLYQKLDQSPELKKFVQEKVFEYVVKKIENKN